MRVTENGEHKRDKGGLQVLGVFCVLVGLVACNLLLDRMDRSGERDLASGLMMV